MRKHLTILLFCCFLLTPIFSAKSSAIAISPDCDSLTGKLQAILKTKNRFRLTVGGKTFFFPSDGSQLNQRLEKAAFTQLHNDVMIIFLKKDHRITAIVPYSRGEVNPDDSQD